MAKALVVVESPAKAKTINKYLGHDYKVMASMGHVRDLPKSRLGVDVDDDFEPVYEVIPSRKKVLTELRQEAKKADEIYLATDPDREGEAIGWHLAEELGTGKKKVRRLMFNEITKKAILEALNHPSDIDMKMVDAQQARRVLDRLVGYKISPLLWDKVRRGLSAGRVQSVALKLVCDREREIEAFRPEEYWNVFARLAAGTPPEFEARLLKRGGAAIKVANEAEAGAILADLRQASWVVSSVTTKERKKGALPPFITSKLQQASRFPVKKTMMLAQQLYEGIELPGEGAVGLITYMRTDSTRVSQQALEEVRAHVGERFGPEYVPDQPNTFRAKADAQDAHEAIRPTSMLYTPEGVRPHLTPDQFYLYRLIWNRFTASQMPPAVFDDTTVDIEAGDYTFRVKGSVPKFAGWMAVYNIEVATEQKDEQKEGPGPDAVSAGDDEDAFASGVLPAMAEGDRLELRELRPEQKFTQPPPRYSEATLVKALEENGIGRPSTYAQIITVLQAREYVNKIEGRFKPTMLGRILVEKLLSPTFDDILDVEYTRKLEEQLDEIEQGNQKYASTLKSFYKQFKKDLADAKKRMPDIKVEGMPPEPPVECDKCGSAMVIKAGKFGLFLACSAYPACENTRELEAPEQTADDLSEECENCGRPMVVKRGRFGQFLACTGYPECKTTRKLLNTKQGLTAAKPDQVLDEKCPECGSNLVVKHGRYGEFTACSNYPKCRYVKHKTTGVMCPKGDGGELVERKSRRGKAFYGCSKYPDCDFTLWNRPVPEKCPDCGAPFLVEKITKRHGRQVICNNEDCSYVRSAELEPVGS
ncbi:MAG TPA: type I DNA topoisomerase [Vicinamibacterales bacterium]|nr:type I DNA topoisomerase [Vicinamibacterales bacterium]